MAPLLITMLTYNDETVKDSPAADPACFEAEAKARGPASKVQRCGEGLTLA